MDNLRPILDRWGVLPPFATDCVNVGYPFCHGSHDVGVRRDGAVFYGNFPQVATVLGVIELPPP